MCVPAYHRAVSHSPFAAAFTPGTRFARTHGGPLVMATREIGRLRVTSGRIVAADPMIVDFAESWLPLAREVPRGDFPVELALAESAGHPTRVACARVRFAAGPALCWEPARFATRAGGEGDAGYEVVHGAGCFFDAAACVPIDEATMRAGEAALARNRVAGWTWHVAALADENVVMFVSPEHDGYPLCYWGFDARRELVELVTDFAPLIEAVTEEFAAPLPLPDGMLDHPWLAERGIMVFRPRLEPMTVIVGGPKLRAFVDPGAERMVVREYAGRDHSVFKWRRNTPGLRLVITLDLGTRPLTPL